MMKVSALTMIHNRADLFRETVSSVLAQTYPVHELVVIDDGSTEDVKSVLDEFHDSRIRYMYVPRIGVISRLRNLAIQQSTGDILAFIDSDDLWHPGKIKKQLDAMEQEQADVVLSDCQFFDEQGPVGPSICHDLLLRPVNVFREMTEHNQTMAFGTNLFFRKYIGGKMVTFDERLFVGEHDLLLRLSARYKVVFVPEILNYIRRHPRNTTVDGFITELISPMEYNRTIDVLRNGKELSKKLYTRIRAANYSKVSGYYLHRKRYQRSSIYAWKAFRLNPRWYYAKILLKSTWRLLWP